MAPENNKQDWSKWIDPAGNKNAQEFFETNLEYEKYLVDPKNERNWADINKDLSLGYLEDFEHQAILNQEKTLRGLMGMKDNFGNDIIGELFVPETILSIYRRMPAFTLALSLSKQGFKQKLMRSMTKESILTARDETPIEYNKGGWGFKRHKKKEEHP